MVHSQNQKSQQALINDFFERFPDQKLQYAVCKALERLQSRDVELSGKPGGGQGVWFMYF
ncbi:MAG: hypothetical protein Tsb009_05250 [Planctomycetaceae bacterium]